jgi:hypothetical protein
MGVVLDAVDHDAAVVGGGGEVELQAALSALRASTNQSSKTKRAGFEGRG